MEGAARQTSSCAGVPGEADRQTICTETLGYRARDQGLVAHHLALALGGLESGLPRQFAEERRLVCRSTRRISRLSPGAQREAPGTVPGASGRVSIAEHGCRRHNRR
jgi:hypothetical protein